MTSHPIADLHFPDPREHLNLIDTHLVLRPQLSSCIHVCGIADKCFQATFSPTANSFSCFIF